MILCAKFLYVKYSGLSGLNRYKLTSKEINEKDKRVDFHFYYDLRIKNI